MSQPDNLTKEWTLRITRHLQGGMKRLPDEVLNRLAGDVVRYAEEHAPFYGRHLKCRGGPGSSYATLNGIPLTTKDDLRKAGMDVVAVPMSQVATYYETTGTTGVPTPCPRSPIDVTTSGMFVQNATARIYHETFGTTQAMTAIMGPSELYAFGDTYGDICRALNIPFVRLWPDSPRVGLEKAADLVLKLGVRSLICSPAVALALARLYLSNGIAPEKTAVENILLLGELCTPEMLANIGRIWKAACTHGLYGSQETHALATGCPSGNLHLSDTNYIYEVLPVNNVGGAVGELCVTMLVPGAKPLIRFRTGDLAHIEHAESCACGRSSRTVRIFGRVDDVLEIGGRTILPAQIEAAILGSMEQVWSYEVRIITNTNGEDALEVNVVAPMKKADIGSCSETVAGIIGVPVEMNLAQVLDARTETGAYVSWKHARIKDERISG